MGRYNVLVVASDNQGGVGFYRSTQPHKQLEKQFKELFEIDYNMHPNFGNLSSFDKYDLIVIHKAIFNDKGKFMNAMRYFKSKKIATILDIDDHWKLNKEHPQYVSSLTYRLSDNMKENMQMFDAVTTTTSLFAKEISKYNKNVYILPNAIDPTDERFIVEKEPSDRVRIGMIMGSTHENDMQLIGNIANKLPKDVIDKLQFVLCGFDLRGTLKLFNKETGTYKERQLQPKEGVWWRYEGMLTDNHKLPSPAHEEFLEMFIPDSEYPDYKNEPYRRCWTKDMDHYYQHYKNCDVLLAPLAVNDFNLVKSPLKCAECCFSHTALIASNFGPYTLDLKSAIEKGGTINPEGNALLVDETKNHKDWAKYITKVVREPELLKMLQGNIYESLHERFDLRNVTKTRAEIYDNLIQDVRKRTL